MLEDERTRLTILRPIEEDLLQRTGNVRERSVIVAPDGSVLLAKDGDADAVIWRVSELTPFVGKVYLVTHNHPRGTSLTPEDLSLTRFLAAREVNAITPRLRFRLVRTGDRWPDGNRLQGVIREVQDTLVGEVLSHIEAGNITERQAELLFYRVLWERVVARFPNEVRYQQEGR